jgi:hypothetical protein
MSAFFDVPTGQQPAGVLLLDPATGLPVAPAAAGGLTNAQLVAALAAALIKTEPLGRLGIAHEITAAANASTTLALQPGTVRLRLSARGANCRVAIGTGAQTASVTTNTANSHFLADGASMDVACLAGSQISVIRGADQTVNGVVHVSELV